MNQDSSTSSLGTTRILILGAGFGGVRAALDLAKFKMEKVHITIISDKHHFGYTPALYKLATGRSPMETCIPLGQIFENKTNVTFVVDSIVGGSIEEKVIIGLSGSRYKYDYLILALGAETSYFGIPGIKEHSFALKSVYTALRLKNHIHKMYKTAEGLTKGELMAQFQFVIVGGGPAGVELAGEIRRYARKLARRHGITEKYVTVDIIQAVPRLLPTMSEKVSEVALHRLNSLGINIILNRPVTAEDSNGVHLKDIQFNAKTIIWTAGVRPSHVYSDIKGLILHKSGRIIVDEHLRIALTLTPDEKPATHSENVFAIGDSANTPFAGTAQTANHDADYVARMIEHTINKKGFPDYKQRSTAYVVPIGEHWAIFTYKNIVLSGRVFAWLRELIDFKYFLSILPFWKAFTVWREGGHLSESCPTCRQAEEEAREYPA